MAFKMKTRLACSAAMGFFVFLSASDAQARCVTTGTNVVCDTAAPNPEPNGASGTQISVLSGATVQLNDPYAGASVRQSTIEVRPSGSLVTQSASQVYDALGNGFTAVVLGNEASATVAGTITASSTSGVGVALASGASITVSAGGVVETTGNGSSLAFQNGSAAIAVKGPNTTIDVEGVVRSTGNNAPVITTSVNGFFGPTNFPTTVTVGSSGSITSAGSSATAIALTGSSSLSVAGAVSASGAGSSAVTYQAGTTGPLTLKVLAGGSITAASAPAIAITGAGATGVTNSLVNAGTIASSSGPAILSANATTLANSGVISGAGGVAVQFGAANDVVTLRDGSAVTGAIVGGGGTDVAILVGTGASAPAAQQVAAFTGFNSLTVQSGYWTAAAANPSAFTTQATINSGAVLDVANGASGLRLTAPLFVDNGMLVVRSDVSSGGGTFGNSVVTGTGGVLFTGAGTATLDGVNSLNNSGTNTVDAGSTLLITGTQGGRFVNNGVLQIGAGGTVGTFTGDVVDNNTLIVNRTDDYAFAGALTGSGIFVQQGTGRVIFGGNYAFTGITQLQGGTIRITAPVAATTTLDVEGTGQIDLSGTNQTIAQLAGASTTASINIAGGSLANTQSTSTSFAGSIVGNGSFTKMGSGALIFTGRNTYTGPTTIAGGILSVNGSIASPVTVASGGTLGGTGRVGTTLVQSGGTYAPGNSIGTQTVAGNLTFASGSTFAVEANAAGQADRVNATGTLTLQGGTVQVLAGAGTYNNLTTYTILTAAGGVTGQFANTTSNLAFLTPFLSYSDTTVTLTLARNDVSFGSVGANPNQVAVGNAISRLGTGSELYRTLLPLTASGAQAALGAFSGEIYASGTAVLADSGRRFREAVLERGSVSGDGIGLWAVGVGDRADSRNETNTAPVSTDRRGVVGGVDFGMSGLRVGVEGGYIRDRIHVPTLGSSAHVGTDSVGAHVSYVAGPLIAQIGGTYAWHDIDTTRSLAGAALGTVSGTDHGHTLQGFGELAYTATIAQPSVVPFARFSYSDTRLDGLTETGGTGALAVAADTHHYEFGTVGVRLTGEAPITQGVTLLPRMSLAYTRGWNLDNLRAASFAGTAGSFSIEGAPLGRDTLDVKGGFDMVFGRRLTLGVSGFGSTSREWSDYGAQAAVSLRF